MTVYKNLSGNSGVSGYESYEDRIQVWFKGSSGSYVYSYASAGEVHVENMKRLAENGSGLNSYINKYVRNRYERGLV